MIKIKRALISVYDKTGISDFAKKLTEFGVEIISTGTTAKIIKESGIAVKPVSEVTNYPEMLNGRVKTLHPAIHGGILAITSNSEHIKQLESQNIKPIEMIVVNLYPFEQTVSRNYDDVQNAIENIDIGGPTLIRAAAKNHQFVAVIVNQKYYTDIINELKGNNGKISLETRKKLASEAFKHTAIYDNLISHYFNDKIAPISEKFPSNLNLIYMKKQNLRYGENPHQKAAFYSEPHSKEISVANSIQLHGKELSYNNIYDLDAALNIIREFKEIAAVVIKHTNPCGCALGANIMEAYIKARACDPISAFGSIVGINRTLDVPTAKEISSTFVEAVICPDFSADAIEILKAKKNLRIIKTGPLQLGEPSKELDFKKVVGGILVQDRDVKEISETDLKVVTKKKPTSVQIENLLFGWKVLKHVKSNAILFIKDLATVGVGAGQMSRVDSVKLAAMKSGENAKNGVMCSDAFFPFRDGLDEAVKVGIESVIQPGGSIRDQEVIDAANELGISMVFTGFRCFKH
ncbi:MAG: bifunctional phosphoribosylaminoimidazolecarboxamide formyltransferase/IMP cyclohydrolase [Candidatus Helarchaeota archaeon]